MKPVAALDFGAEQVLALIAEKDIHQNFKILGAGEAEARGFKDGRMVHVGDAAEAVSEALGKAQKQAKRKIKKLYFNFDDLKLESALARGSRTLKGEGEVRDSDIQAVCQIAKRLVQRFDKEIVYAKEIHFLIDDRDSVLNPRGVFGRKLDVWMHVLQANTESCQNWQKVMRRSFVKGIPVLSAWSTAYGILPKEDRQRRRLIVDLGRDYTTLFIFENDAIQEHCTLLTSGVDSEPGSNLDDLCRQMMESKKNIDQILITGDLAESEKILKRFGNFMIPCQLASPFGQPKLLKSRYASLAGLMEIADEMESKITKSYAKKGLMRQAQEKASSFIKEYF